MKAITLFIFFFTYSIQIFSQADIPVFDKMFGLWEGTYELNGVQYKEKLSTMWVLNHNFYEMVIMGEDINHKESRYEEMLFFGVSKEGNITGWSMDYEGLGNMVNYEGTIYENKVSVTGGNLNKKCTLEFELKDNKIIQRREITKNNEPSIKKEITYTSIRYDYKIYSLPTVYEKISEPGLAYICQLTEHFVTVINTKTNELIGKINCSNGSAFIRFSPDNKTGYISNFNSGNITVFDKSTNNTIATVEAGENPSGILPVDKYLLISHESRDGLWILDRNTNSIIEKKSWGTGFLYLIEKENKIYQPQIFSPFLLVIDPNTFEIKKRIKTDGRPMGMAFIQNQRFGYLPNFDLNEVTKFDVKNDAIIKHIKNINNPRGIAASPDGKYIYITNVVDGKVTVINTELDSVIKVIDGFKMPVDVSFTPDGKFAYVLNQSEATISVINTESYSIEETINVAYNPITIFIDY